MNAEKLKQNLYKLKDLFLVETEENKKMLDIYISYIDGHATEKEIDKANKQLRQIFKSLGLGILTVLPFSPISIPYVLKKAKEYDIDIVPEWYKSLSNDKDRLE